VVELLVDRNDAVADSRDNSDRTPLSWAAERRHEMDGGAAAGPGWC
jgi:ankyrin repeat protein